MAQRLELDPPRLTGDPAMVAKGVRFEFSNGYAEFSVSRNGTLFYGQGSGGERVRYGWRDRAGKLLETIGQPVEARGGNLSPDGSWVAYPAGPGIGQSDIWVLELARGLSRQVTFSNATTPRWSPDGKFLLYGNGDIMTLPLTGEAKPQAYLQTKYEKRNAAFSPDGRWVAYNSDVSGRDEIWVQGFPERRGKWPVSTEGGRTPAWRADGKELYWVGLDRTLMAASVELQAAGVRVGRTEALFRLPTIDVFARFQPGRDGRQFLVQELEGTSQDRPMVVQLNWAGRLGR